MHGLLNEAPTPRRHAMTDIEAIKQRHEEVEQLNKETRDVAPGVSAALAQRIPQSHKDRATLLAEVERLQEWQPIETAPRYKPVRVRLECGFEAAAVFKSRSCTGMCSPKGQPPHAPHIHDEWVFVDEGGDELHPVEGYRAIEPTHWMPLPAAPEPTP